MISFKEYLNEKYSVLNEVLDPSAPVSAWIHDFVHYDNPKFKGKSEDERRRMALGAYYSQKGKK